MDNYLKDLSDAPIKTESESEYAILIRGRLLNHSSVYSVTSATSKICLLFRTIHMSPGLTGMSQCGRHHGPILRAGESEEGQADKWKVTRQRL